VFLVDKSIRDVILCTTFFYRNHLSYEWCLDQVAEVSKKFWVVKMCGICCFSIQKDNLQIVNRQNSSHLFRRKFVAVKISQNSEYYIVFMFETKITLK